MRHLNVYVTITDKCAAKRSSLYFKNEKMKNAQSFFNLNLEFTKKGIWKIEDISCVLSKEDVLI